MSEYVKNKIDYYQSVSVEIQVKFFFHWAILSGATLTLFIPLYLRLVDDQKINLVQAEDLKLAVLLIFGSMITSSIRNFVAGKALFQAAMQTIKLAEAKKLTKKETNYGVMIRLSQRFLETFSLSSYVAGLAIIFLVIFSIY